MPVLPSLVLRARRGLAVLLTAGLLAAPVWGAVAAGSGAGSAEAASQVSNHPKPVSTVDSDSSWPF